MTDDRFAIDSLRSCPLFFGCERGVLESVASHLRVRRFRRNEVIFHQGDAGDSLHIIASGSVKIVLPSAEGDEAIIATLHPPDFFGELALLDGRAALRHRHRDRADRDIGLSRPVFMEQLNAHTQLRDALLSALVTELRRLTGHVEELHFLDLAGRLARRLVQLSEQTAPSASGEVASTGRIHSLIWRP